jgi:hypothetical protein
MIDAAVQGDVDGIAKGSHGASLERGITDQRLIVTSPIATESQGFSARLILCVRGHTATASPQSHDII